MQKNLFILFNFLMLLSLNARADYVAHEWGTFTSLMGSNGVRQNGMYHEDEALPSFVHHYGEEMNLELPNGSSVALLRPHCPPHSKACFADLRNQTITQKMETPVLYFYSDKARSVAVDVGFPKGIIAESYPLAVANYPKATPHTILTNGFSHYEVNILTDNHESPIDVPNDNIYSHARKTKSNLIKSGNEIEKFIFYRGIGNFSTDLKITSEGNNLQVINSGKEIPAVFLLNFDEFGGNVKNLGNVKAGQIVKVSDLEVNFLKQKKMPFKDYIQKARSMIQLALIKNGLYFDEAVALLDTWEQSYLKTPGLRVLYVLNRDEVERILPMNITPAPRELTRVFIGRVEVLTESEEQKLFQDVLNEGEKFHVGRLGRMAHPIANRLLEMALVRKLTGRALSYFQKIVTAAETI